MGQKLRAIPRLALDLVENDYQQLAMCVMQRVKGAVGSVTYVYILGRKHTSVCCSDTRYCVLLTPGVWVFHTSSNSATPTWCRPTSQLSSDTVFKDLAAEPTGKGFNPTRLPLLQIPLQIAHFKLSTSVPMTPPCI